MFAAQEAHQPDEDAVTRRAPVRDAAYAPIERHGYQPPKSSRVFGSIGTIAVGALIAAGFVVTLDRFDRPVRVSPPLVVTLLPVASPQPPQPKRADKPKPVQKTPNRPEPPKVDPVPPPIVSLPSPSAPVASPQKAAADPRPAPTPAAPPPAAPPAAAPAQAPSSHGPDTWEGRVLARLERYRRYPSDAQHARQQGTAYIRFRISRDGHVLSSSLDRSSGYPALDDAALETLRRADPLPKIPADRPDEIELLVPIEFFIQR